MIRGNLKRNNHRRDVAAKTQILNATEMHQSENDGSDAIRPADGNSIIQRTHWRLDKKLLFALTFLEYACIMLSCRRFLCRSEWLYNSVEFN